MGILQKQRIKKYKYHAFREMSNHAGQREYISSKALIAQGHGAPPKLRRVQQGQPFRNTGLPLKMVW
jgi:hypothetical protein